MTEPARGPLASTSSHGAVAGQDATIAGDPIGAPGALGSQGAEVVRSEERLATGTRRQVTGRVRYGRRIVTEERTVTVTLRREEFFLEQAPPAEGTASDPGVGNRGLGDRGPGEPAAEDRAYTVVLREEVPVVGTSLVPVERVTVRIDTVRGEHQVSADVSREVVDVVEDPSDRPRW